ncbi:hypothetical protein Vadar_001166 [Vaccinium darrowii]|uniref:Uncharacterized protein n=1 Tax=Vaccinium darrowii TaxID=229202 RepID=A0ACB7X738_9ERIC|nr:hypothetical protein Vadar_001166 [Vaccinium darrowii]
MLTSYIGICNTTLTSASTTPTPSTSVSTTPAPPTSGCTITAPTHSTIVAHHLACLSWGRSGSLANVAPQAGVVGAYSVDAYELTVTVI